MLRTEYICVWSPGARVGHAWLNVDAMNGSSGVDLDAGGTLDVEGRGIDSGMFGLEVADVGRGGREIRERVRPGIRRVTTLFIERAF